MSVSASGLQQRECPEPLGTRVLVDVCYAYGQQSGRGEIPAGL